MVLLTFFFIFLKLNSMHLLDQWQEDKEAYSNNYPTECFSIHEWCYSWIQHLVWSVWGWFFIAVITRRGDIAQHMSEPKLTSDSIAWHRCMFHFTSHVSFFSSHIYQLIECFHVQIERVPWNQNNSIPTDAYIQLYSKS